MEKFWHLQCTFLNCRPNFLSLYNQSGTLHFDATYGWLCKIATFWTPAYLLQAEIDTVNSFIIMVNLFNCYGVLTWGHHFYDFAKSHHNLTYQTDNRWDLFHIQSLMIFQCSREGSSLVQMCTGFSFIHAFSPHSQYWRHLLSHSREVLIEVPWFHTELSLRYQPTGQADHLKKFKR